MTKERKLAFSAVAIGSFLAYLDFTSSSSLSLLAANSTVLIALTAASVALVAASTRAGSIRSRERALERISRSPLEAMTELAKGAHDGYVSNRKDVARIFRTAVDAKIQREPGLGPVKRNDEDEFLRSAVGGPLFAEFFAEDEWKIVRVASSHGYISRLAQVIVLVKRSLELHHNV